MSRLDILIVKETHRGLLYEDGALRDVLPAGRYHIPKPPTGLAAFFGREKPRVEVVLVDVRGRERTVMVQDLLTADGVTISASFIVHYRVADPKAAVHLVKNFEERLYAEAQTAARRSLRGLSLEELMASRDEIGEELQRIVGESASAYGLEVSALDFKDLVLPEDLRSALGRAAVAKRLRLAKQAEAAVDDREIGVAAETRDDFAVEPEEAEVVLARASFGRESGGRDDGPILRPHGVEHTPSVPHGGGFEGLRRFRP